MSNTEQTFRLRWRGSEQGPFTLDQIRQQLAGRQIGLLHEIRVDIGWVTLRDFFAAEQQRLQQEQAEAQAQAQAAKAATEQRMQEQLIQQQAALVAEERRKNDLLAAAVQVQTPKKKSGSSFLSVMGWMIFILGLGMGTYFLLIFDQTVATSSGNRVNNIGLMQDRQVGLIFGLGLLIVGVMMAIFGRSKPKE